jgi:hypothetical protein
LKIRTAGRSTFMLASGRRGNLSRRLRCQRCPAPPDDIAILLYSFRDKKLQFGLLAVILKLSMSSQVSVICLDDVEQDQPKSAFPASSKYCLLTAKRQRTTQRLPKSDEQYLPNSFEALKKQGIFYHDTPPSHKYAKHLFIPTTDDKDWNSPGEYTRRRFARRAVKHASRNTISNRSEFSWEADAWIDVFGRLRDDPCLEA